MGRILDYANLSCWPREIHTVWTLHNRVHLISEWILKSARIVGQLTTKRWEYETLWWLHRMRTRWEEYLSTSNFFFFSCNNIPVFMAIVFNASAPVLWYLCDHNQVQCVPTLQAIHFKGGQSSLNWRTQVKVCVPAPSLNKTPKVEYEMHNKRHQWCSLTNGAQFTAWLPVKYSRWGRSVSSNHWQLRGCMIILHSCLVFLITAFSVNYSLFSVLYFVLQQHHAVAIGSHNKFNTWDTWWFDHALQNGQTRATVNSVQLRLNDSLHFREHKDSRHVFFMWWHWNVIWLGQTGVDHKK